MSTENEQNTDETKKMSLYVPLSLWKSLQMRKIETGKTVNKIITEMIEDGLKQEKLNAAAREAIKQTKKAGRSPVYTCPDNPHQLLREHPDGTIEEITYADLEAENSDS